MNLTDEFNERARARGVPAKLTIELLAPCNLACPHCYVTHTKKNRLTRDVLIRIFDEAAQAGTLELQLTGGEIGLRKDLFDIVADARARHFAVSLLTSGTRFGPREWDRIADLGVSTVRLSLYAMTACVHDTVTATPGSHELTLATVRGLHERGVQVSVSCPALAANAHEVGKVAAFARALGIEVGVDAHITLTDRGNAATKSTAASFDQLVEMFSDPEVRPLFYMPDSACRTPASSETSCSVGQHSAFIQCTGDLYPCVNWPTPAGNVVDTSLVELFRTSRVFEHARAVTFASQTGCNGCGDKHLCKPCVAMNLAENNSIGEPSSIVCRTTAALATAYHGGSNQQPYRRSQTHPRLRIVGS